MDSQRRSVLARWLFAAFLCAAAGCATKKIEVAQPSHRETHIGIANIGTRNQMKAQAAEDAKVLAVWAQRLLNLAGEPNIKSNLRYAAQGLATDIANVQDHLDLIAAAPDERTLASAIFSLCNGGIPDASAHTGAWMICAADRTHSKASLSKDPLQASRLAQIAQYDATLGRRLIAVPLKCQHAQQGIAVASLQAKYQTDAEATTDMATVLSFDEGKSVSAVGQPNTSDTQKDPAHQQWERNIELQDVKLNLRRQNCLLQQHLAPKTPPK